MSLVCLKAIKRLLLFLPLLFLASPAFASNCSGTTFTNTVIKCVQSNTSDCGAVTDCSLAYGSNPTAGNFLLVCADFFQFSSNANAIAATETVNDTVTQNNSWTTRLNPTLWASGALSLNAQDSKEACFTAIAKATAADTPHIVTSGGGTPAGSFISIYELSSTNGTIGVDATAAFVDSGGVGTTTCPSSNMTPTKNGDLLYGYCNYADGGVTSAGSGWTELDTAPVSQGEGQATAATVNSVWVVASMSHDVAGAIAFSDGSAGGGGSLPPTITLLGAGLACMTPFAICGLIVALCQNFRNRENENVLGGKYRELVRVVRKTF
jgi:hypothetical protein